MKLFFQLLYFLGWVVAAYSAFTGKLLEATLALLWCVHIRFDLYELRFAEALTASSKVKETAKL